MHICGKWVHFILLYTKGQYTELKIRIRSWPFIKIRNIIITDYYWLPHCKWTYSKFIPPYSNLPGHMLKWVRKWPMADHFDLWIRDGGSIHLWSMISLQTLCKPQNAPSTWIKLPAAGELTINIIQLCTCIGECCSCLVIGMCQLS